MAPARSIQCISRPPSRAFRGLVSFGNTISDISDCESRTGRGASRSSVMDVFPSSSFLLQVRFQKTLRHPLDARIVMPPQPPRLRQIEFEIAMSDRPMISFANITEYENAGRS